MTLLYGVSKYLFSSLALAVVLSLIASYLVAMTLVPLFCARFMHPHQHSLRAKNAEPAGVSTRCSSADFDALLRVYNRVVLRLLSLPVLTMAVFAIAFGAACCSFRGSDFHSFRKPTQANS